MKASAVLVAAGSGTRLGADGPKALVALSGAPLLTHAVRRLRASALVRSVTITAPAGYGQAFAAAAALATADDDGPPLDLHVVEGSYPSRQASVAAGLAGMPTGLAGVPTDAAPGGDEVIVVHDSARPLAPAAMITRLLQGIREGHRAVVPVLPVTDTIRRVDPGEPTRSLGVVDRSALRAIQTPQAFIAPVLRQAHAAAAERAGNERTAATDDAALVEELRIPVHLVPGERAAMKITDRLDLDLAQVLLWNGGE